MSDKIDFLANFDELEQFRPKWNALFEVSDATPYQSYEWVVSALRHFSKEGGFIVASVTDELGLKCIIPLEIIHEKIGPLPQKVVTFVAEGWALRNSAILAARAQNEEVNIIVNAISALALNGISWDYCRFSLIGATTAALMKDKAHTQVRNVFLEECVKIGGSVVIETENYFEQAGSKKRSELKRKTKLLGQIGTMRMVRLGLGDEIRREELDHAIDDALIIAKCTWQGEATIGRAICDDGVREFFRESCHSLAERKMLDLSIMYVDNLPVSFIWGHTRKNYSSLNKIGFNPEFSKYSVGELHIAWFIEDSGTLGIKEINLGHEFTSWKKRWSKREDVLYNVLLYRKGVVPYVVRKLRTIKRKVSNV